MRHVLITGGLGFIGRHLVESLVAAGDRVTVLDLKYEVIPGARTIVGNIRYPFDPLFDQPVDVIVHLAALAGVRPSLENPELYADVNINGTIRLLEFARAAGVKQFVFASSSSVYGVNPNVPWKEDDHVLQPISPYASTKISGELLGHVYTHLHGIRFLALRLFTVYGPRQRPDLAINKFAGLILNGRPIPLYGDGSTRRDYTYVDDIVAGIRGAMAYEQTPFEVVNLGNDRAVSLIELVRALEDVLDRKAAIEWLPEQPGDVPQTWANTDKARRLLGYRSKTLLLDGLRRFLEWMPSVSTKG